MLASRADLSPTKSFKSNLTFGSSLLKRPRNFSERLEFLSQLADLLPVVLEALNALVERDAEIERKCGKSKSARGDTDRFGHFAEG
jgi:hypothetical protein